MAYKYCKPSVNKYFVLEKFVYLGSGCFNFLPDDNKQINKFKIIF